GHGIDFFACGTSRDPDADGVVDGAARNKRGKHAGVQGLKCRRLAEKGGHVDQQILKKGLGLAAPLAQKSRIIRKSFDFMYGHSPVNSAADGAVFIKAEIDAGSS